MTSSSPGVGYVRRRVDGATPSVPGSYEFRPGNGARLVWAIPLLLLASGWVLWMGLQGKAPWFLIPLGVVALAFFGLATLLWFVQRLVVQPTGLGTRIPLPGQRRVLFTEVAAIVVFPRVRSAAPTACHVFLIRQDGRVGFRLAAPPLEATLLEAVASLAQRVSGAPAFFCTTEVSDRNLAVRLAFPQLTGAPGARDPETWRPQLPLLG